MCISHITTVIIHTTGILCTYAASVSRYGRNSCPA